MAESPERACTPQRLKFERAPGGKSGSARLSLIGELCFEDAAHVSRELRTVRKKLPGTRALDIDLSRLSHIDGGSAALLLHAQEKLRKQGVQTAFVDASAVVNGVFDMYREAAGAERPKRRRAPGMLDQVGRAFLEILFEVKLVFSFIGQLLISLGRVFRSPRTVNWSEVPRIMETAGADALPIVLLINFLVGLVMAFQSSTQLKNLGANILVADLIGISVTRELAPLMTAIVVSGRSGAAFAAEFGAMRVNEEIDALYTMGLSVTRFMVLPRVIGLMIAMPLLTLFADLVGIVGGLVVGVSVLDLTATGYFNELQKVVKHLDVYEGLIKSIAFALAIALISSQQGLVAEGGAEGVGKRTTSAVVITLFVLILVDAAFTIAFKVGRA